MQHPESEEYPATLACSKCGQENTLDSMHCKRCGHWLVGEWEAVRFKKVQQVVSFGWGWAILFAALGIGIGVLIGINL